MSDPNQSDQVCLSSAQTSRCAAGNRTVLCERLKAVTERSALEGSGVRRSKAAELKLRRAAKYETLTGFSKYFDTLCCCKHQDNDQARKSQNPLRTAAVNGPTVHFSGADRFPHEQTPSEYTSSGSRVRQHIITGEPAVQPEEGVASPRNLSGSDPSKSAQGLDAARLFMPQFLAVMSCRPPPCSSPALLVEDDRGTSCPVDPPPKCAARGSHTFTSCDPCLLGLVRAALWESMCCSFRAYMC